MDDPSLAHEVIDQFHTLGVRTIIDDFGTGYSSLSFLQTLPIHGIKIDRSFVGQMGAGDNGAETIVRSIIDLGRNLGLEVVAVGVQSPELHQRLPLLQQIPVARRSMTAPSLLRHLPQAGHLFTL